MAAEGEHSVLYEPVNRVWEGIASATGIEERFGHISVPDHVVMAIFVLFVSALVFIPLSRTLKRDKPGKFQQMMELLFEGLYNMIEDLVGHGAGRRFLPLIGSFAVFIFLSNLTGGIFFLQPPTQNPNTTFALSVIAVVIYHLMGLRAHGLGYFKQFLGPGPPPVWLWPLMLPIELISHAARVLSLGLRLYGNIFGEHVALGIFVGLVPFLVPLPLMALGLFAGTIQTFIFIILTTLYIAGAEAEEH